MFALCRVIRGAVDLAVKRGVSTPVFQRTPMLTAADRSMKVKASLKKLCEHCRLVKRERVLYVYCSRDPKHKQVSTLVALLMFLIESSLIVN